MERQTPFQDRLDQLASNLVVGREYAPRTPHNYAHRTVLRLGDAQLQDTVAFEPISVIELFPDAPATLAEYRQAA